MELIEGASLAEIIEVNKSLPEPIIAHVTKQVLH